MNPSRPAPSPSSPEPSLPPAEPIPPHLLLRRALGIATHLAAGLARFRLLSRHTPLTERAALLQRLCRALVCEFGIEPVPTGFPSPPAGRGSLLVANHVGFTDILVLGSLHPIVFVSKADVARWPIIGPIAKAAGTLFVQREKRGDVARVNQALAQTLASGVHIALFPEGTSSDGETVLPFQPSLLQPAIDLAAPITPVHLRYHEPSGARIDEIAYFGDRLLADCLRALILRRQTLCSVRYGNTAPAETPRKPLALRLREEVLSLAPRDQTPSPSILSKSTARFAGNP